MPVPELRVQVQKSNPVRTSGDYVLYWMTAQRRLAYNFALQRAVDWAVDLGKPLLIFEPLRVNYRWASTRLHQFVLEGMLEHAAACQNAKVAYYPYVEPAPGMAQGLLPALAERACLVVTDDFPCFFIPALLRAGLKQVDCRVETVDSAGLFPLRGTQVVHHRAYDFRRTLQKQLPPHLLETPLAAPLEHPRLKSLSSVPQRLLKVWPAFNLSVSAGTSSSAALSASLAKLPIDHSIPPGMLRGGSQAAVQRMQHFLDVKLAEYGTLRSEPEQDATSGLSPYLHFGHISVHQVFAELVKREGWKPGQLGKSTSGAREGWWGMSPAAESFLDELVTWREVGYNFCHLRRDYDRYESLPDWAQKTLAKHATDRREHVYSLDDFAASQTHDPLWNAAQRQLVREGRMHNYLRMLWGKKILEWSASPRDALTTMVELNNKYALDGRNPNSYSGIMWTLGRYDRAWGPERSIFGTIRYMSSENTARKLEVKDYLRRYAATPESPPTRQTKLFPS